MTQLRGEWRPVVGYEGRYEVSSLGYVRSIERKLRKSRLGRTEYDYVVPARLMQTPLRAGYPSVTLYLDGIKTRLSLHRIVAEAFIGPCNDGLVVCHIDGNRLNNHSDNLRYDTPRNNSADMERHGTLLIGEKNHLAKLTEDDVRGIRSLAGTKTHRELARQFGVSRPAIGYIIRREVWRHLP